MLAKAEYQSTYLLTDLPLSRASRIVAPPLPHLNLYAYQDYLQSCAANSSREGLIADASGLRSYRNTLVPSWDL